MREVAPELELAKFLAAYKACGGVLDYVFLEAGVDVPSKDLHRAAALAGMSAISGRMEQWAIHHASAEFPIEEFFRVRWEPCKLVGEQVPFSTFWGTDDAEPKAISANAWSIPSVDGYKTAFFHPPHGLANSKQDPAALFNAINSFVIGNDPERTEIFSWSTDWSNYFDAGNEWWGAYFWTIRSIGSKRFVVIGASSTD